MKNIEIGNNKRIQIVGSAFGALHGAFEDGGQIMTIFAGVKFNSDEHANYLIAACDQLQKMENQKGAQAAFEAFTSDFLKNAVDGYKRHDALRAPLLPIASSLRKLISERVGGNLNFQPATFLFNLCGKINCEIIRLVVGTTKVEELRMDAPAHNLSNLLCGPLISEGHEYNPVAEIRQIGMRYDGRDERKDWLRKALLFYFQALYSTREIIFPEKTPESVLKWHRSDINGFKVLRQGFAEQIAKMIDGERASPEVFKLIAEITNNHAYNAEVPAALWSEPAIVEILVEAAGNRRSRVAESEMATIRIKIMKMVEGSSRYEKDSASQIFGKAVFDLFVAMHESNTQTTYLADWKHLLRSKMLQSLDLHWQTPEGQDTAGFSLSDALGRVSDQRTTHAKLIKLGKYAPPSLHNWFKKALRNRETHWWHKHRTGLLLWRWEINSKWRKWTAK